MDRDYCIVRPSMAQQSTSSHARLAVYSYLRPLIEGRRVLELGSGSGEGAAHLLSLGARTVFQNRDMERLFVGLGVTESFLLLNKTREVLLRKKAPPAPKS